MSFTSYSPSTDTWHAALSIPDNGQGDDAASLFDGTAKYAADNAKYVRARSPGAIGATLHVPLNAPIYNCKKDGTAGVCWAVYVGSALGAGTGCWSQTDITDEGCAGWEITGLLAAAGLLGGVITGYSMQVDGDLCSGTPPHAALPATMPIVRLREIVLSTGVGTVVSTVTDTSSTQAIYDADHSVTATCAVTTAATKRYVLEVLGEASTHAEAGLALKDLTVTVSPRATA